MALVCGDGARAMEYKPKRSIQSNPTIPRTLLVKRRKKLADLTDIDLIIKTW